MKKLIVIALAVFAASQVFATEYVTNGDFSAGSAGWTESTLLPPPSEMIGDWSNTIVTSAGDLGPSGNTAWMGGYANADDSITQTIAPIAPASHGTLSFDLWIDNEDIPGYDFLNVTYGASNIATIDLGDYNPVGLYHYSESFDVSNLLDGTSKDLKFEVTTGDSLPSAAFVGNVSLQANATPEPASMAVLGLGAAALIRRRRK